MSEELETAKHNITVLESMILISGQIRSFKDGVVQDHFFDSIAFFINVRDELKEIVNKGVNTYE